MTAVVADDDSDSAATLAILAGACAADVSIVDNGKSAVVKAMEKGSSLRLVLLDMEMPGLNGFDAGMQIRLALGVRPVIIGFSGSAYLLEAARSSGFFDRCYEKPAVGAEFLRDIDALCKGRDISTPARTIHLIE